MTTLLALAALAFADPTVADIVQKKFVDATFVAKVKQADQKELAKIGKDFGLTYRLKEVKSYIKEPLMLRLEANVEGTKINYFVYDWVRYYRLPGINSKEDLHGKPGKLQSAFDYGILTPALFEQVFDAKYLRTDRANGDYVFDLTYKAKFNDSARHRIWVDPQKKCVTKREWFGQDGHQVGTFFYEDPMNRDGVWFPSRGIVKNMDGKVAGIVEYESVKMNSGLAESLFKP